MGIPFYGQNKDGNAIDNSVGVVKHIKPASDGTAVAGAETVILASSDGGNRYFVDISANTATFRLPSAYTNKGMQVHFHLDIASDAEATKDLLIFTDSTAEYIMGPLIDGGTIQDSGVSSDGLRIDTSDGAAGGGDYASLICDGKHWYLTSSGALTAGAWNVETATRA
tara:strand:- start:3468 stop:3971 length:504 start_codon:yes stop_codon:yes gene_type:complete